jgi:hypothetical protein
MSRLKKLIKVQSHRQFALQQLSADSRMSEEIKQFHSEQVEFADRDGVVKALNFLLSLVRSTAIPISDQIRSQVSKLVSLLRIRDELQLHEQIRKRELGGDIPLVLTRDCPIEFPHWDETFVMLKLKKFSITFMEDHRARQELIASILRREAEIERKKSNDAELQAAIQAQKAAADQLLIQKSLDAAKEKSQRALEAAKEKEQRALEATKDKEQRALDAAKDKAQQSLDAAKEKGHRALEAAEEKEQRESAARIEQRMLDAAKDKAQQSLDAAKEKEHRALEAAEKKEQRESAARIEQHRFDAAKESDAAALHTVKEQGSNSILDIYNENLSSTLHVTKPTVPDENITTKESYPQLFDGTEQLSGTNQFRLPLPPHKSPCNELETDQFLAGAKLLEFECSAFENLRTNDVISTKAPCQSPKSIGQTPRPIDLESLRNPSNEEMLIFESHQSNTLHGPWRPFISSSRYLQTVDVPEMNLSPFEMALNLSCLAAAHSFPILHGTASLKCRRMQNPSKDDFFGNLHVLKHPSKSDSLPLLHHLPGNTKLLEDMNFEEVQLDRALRALRRCSDSSSKISIYAYEEILLHQKKLMSLLLPLANTNGKSGDLRDKSPSLGFYSTSQCNTDSGSVNSLLPSENFTNTNRLPLKTNLAAQRRRVLLAKFSFPKSSSAESMSSNTADILHLESMGSSINNRNRGDLWKKTMPIKESPKFQKRFYGDSNCQDIIDEVKVSFGSASYATKSLLLGSFAQEVKSSLNRSFHERYSAAGKSVKW